MSSVSECENEFHQTYKKCDSMERGQQREDCHRNSTDEFDRCLDSVYGKAIDEHKLRCKKACEKIYNGAWLKCKTDDCRQIIIKDIDFCSTENFKMEVGMYNNRSGIVFW